MAEILTDSLIGTVLGFGGAIAQEIVEVKKQKQAFAHELSMTREKIKLADAETKNKIKVMDIEADIEEMKRLYEHDIAIGQGTGPFIASLRSSVRPVITYAFFILFMGLKVATFIILAKELGSIDINLLSGLWDSNTSTLFSAIMSYWFGRRSIEKRYTTETSATNGRRIAGPIT